MQLIAPDLLTEAHGLSPFLSGMGVALGGLLWLFGWHWRRFWVVVAITVAGGIIGLQTGRSTGGHILAMGVLLAFSAGLLALELARVLSFVAAGTAVWLATNALFPRGQELWVAFLVGGSLGVLLYRFWTMILMSFAGVMIGSHSLLCFIESFCRFDAPGFANGNASIINGGVLAATCLGLIAQSFFDRWRRRCAERRKHAAEERKFKEEREKEREKILASVAKLSEPASMWDRLLGKKKAA